MRVMVLVKANEDSERGDYSGHEEDFLATGKYNEELLKVGDHAGRRGPHAVVGRQAGRRSARTAAARVIDGPFAEAKELVGGFWIWQVSVSSTGALCGERPRHSGRRRSRVRLLAARARSRLEAG